MKVEHLKPDESPFVPIVFDDPEPVPFAPGENPMEQEWKCNKFKITFESAEAIETDDFMRHPDEKWYQVIIDGRKTPLFLQTPSSEVEFALYMDDEQFRNSMAGNCIASGNMKDGFNGILQRIQFSARTSSLKQWQQEHDAESE